MNSTKLIFAGGFLGAGKTTLLWEAARRLTSRGQRVGLITNDQAPNLVDTGLLARQGFDVREVAGSCFCCNFNALIDAASALRAEIQADVLIGEPVGSCTDLSATILQPLKDRYAQDFELTPLSVLVDPLRVREVLNSEKLHLDAAYIYRKQLEEADIILINKADLLTSNERASLFNCLTGEFPGVLVRFISALTGEGVDEWLDLILAGGDAGSKITDVDYDRYARGEAVLGWLNATGDIAAAHAPVEGQNFCRSLLETLKSRFVQHTAEVGHVKVMLASTDGTCLGNLTSKDGDVSIRGGCHGSSQAADFVLNARVEMSPEELERIVRESIAEITTDHVAVRLNQLRSLSPGRPVPTHRYANIV